MKRSKTLNDKLGQYLEEGTQKMKKEAFGKNQLQGHKIGENLICVKVPKQIIWEVRVDIQEKGKQANRWQEAKRKYSN